VGRRFGVYCNRPYELDAVGQLSARARANIFYARSGLPVPQNDMFEDCVVSCLMPVQIQSVRALGLYDTSALLIFGVVFHV